jgi:hypothetical protein
MQKLLIITGLILLAAGLAWPWLRRLPLGRLPGDIHIAREGFSFSFPIVTCLVISVVVSLPPVVLPPLNVASTPACQKYDARIRDSKI